MVDTSPTVAREVAREHRTYWWKEALIMASFYAIYTVTRNRFGSIQVSDTDIPLHSFNNAMKIIRIERALGLYHEETIQEVFLRYDWFIQLLNTYYGTAHFAVTIGVFAVLFVKRKDVFPFYRNALAFSTGLAIIGFALFPLMPPRLLDSPCPPVDFGGQCIEHELRNYNGARTFGYVDTLAEYGGPWNFDEGRIAKMSNQYAAMPSLHIGWATWCAFGVWPLARRRWVRAAVLLYPATTLFTIVVTGNHYWIDGVGGWLVLGCGFLGAWWLRRWNDRRDEQRHERASTAQG